MLQKIDNRQKKGSAHIKILYPGAAIGLADTGMATIGRIDQAALPAGSFIAMHPHINDEILSYFRSGKVQHTDSTGFSEHITPSRLMLMKAGSSFFHEEKILDDSDLLEGLQIFIRPREKDLTPEVQFHELATVHSDNKWRLLAAPTADVPLQLRSDTWIYDLRLTSEKPIELPTLPKEKLTLLLYVFQGEAMMNNSISLTKGESLVIKEEEDLTIYSAQAELVLFATDEQSAYFDGGMYSGNQN